LTAGLARLFDWVGCTGSVAGLAWLVDWIDCWTGQAGGLGWWNGLNAGLAMLLD
jgi:hypothetical protein